MFSSAHQSSPTTPTSIPPPLDSSSEATFSPSSPVFAFSPTNATQNSSTTNNSDDLNDDTTTLKLEPAPVSPTLKSSTRTCPICSRQFQNRGRLDIHMRTHTDERPFPCTQCPLRFRQKCHLARHLGTHSQRALRPFACRVCDRRFRQASNCRAHEQRHLRAESRVNRSLSQDQLHVIEQIRSDYASGQTRPAPVAIVDNRVDEEALAMLEETKPDGFLTDGVKLEAVGGFVQAKWQKSPWKKSSRASPPPNDSVQPTVFPEPTVVKSINDSAIKQEATPTTPVVRGVPAVLPVPQTTTSPMATTSLVKTAELKPATTVKPLQTAEQTMSIHGDGCAPSWHGLSLMCGDSIDEDFDSSDCSSPSAASACSSPCSESSDSSFASFSTGDGDSMANHSTTATMMDMSDVGDLSFLALSVDLVHMAGMVPLPVSSSAPSMSSIFPLNSNAALNTRDASQGTASALSMLSGMPERWMAGVFEG